MFLDLPCIYASTMVQRQDNTFFSRSPLKALCSSPSTPVLTSFPGLPPPLLLQVQFAEQPVVLLQHLVVHQHVVWRLTGSLPGRGRRGRPAELGGQAGPLLQLADVVPVVEAVDGSVLLHLVPGADLR